MSSFFPASKRSISDLRDLDTNPPRSARRPSPAPCILEWTEPGPSSRFATGIFSKMRNVPVSSIRFRTRGSTARQICPPLLRPPSRLPLLLQREHGIDPAGRVLTLAPEIDDMDPPHLIDPNDDVDGVVALTLRYGRVRRPIGADQPVLGILRCPALRRRVEPLYLGRSRRSPRPATL